ncbi:hypothetical protein [Kineococcus gypseus]|uniref:hypothetical protein n=1 Tax=Kineococcus gypseus TaxID=1637102 RepID=UPI003D7DAA04
MEPAAVRAPSPRPAPSTAAVLAVALLTSAVLVSAWVLWQLTAAGRAPRAFTERDPYRTCPPVHVPQGREPPPLQECLTSPGARREGVEVRVTTLTTEGDPVRTYYRALPGGAGVEVFVDATDDSFGSERWEHLHCPDVAALSTFEDCRSR